MNLKVLTQIETPLETIYEEFKQLRTEYIGDPYKGSGDKGELDRLQDYADRFTELHTQIRPICTEVYGFRTKHDDKAATAIRSRIAQKLLEDKVVNSLNKAEQMAPSTDEYSEFLENRIFYYKSWDSINHLRESIKQYIINIGQRLSHFK